MEVELLSQHRIDSEESKLFKYNLNLTGNEVLAALQENLEIKNPHEKAILIYKNQNNIWNLVDMDNPMSNLNICDSCLLATSLSEYKCKIVNDYKSDVERSIMLDLTKPIKEMLSMISEKLRFNCQAYQYTLYTEIEGEKKKPLDNEKPIAVQTSRFKRMYFKRRFFSVFAMHFQELDSCLHIYRDMRHEYIHGGTKITDVKKAAQIARLIAYGDSVHVEDVEKIDFEKKLKKYIPKSLKGKNISKNILNEIKKNPPMDRTEAMKTFIKTARTLDGFGSESMKCILNGQFGDKKYENKHCIVVSAPRGLLFYEKGSDEFFLHISPVKMVHIEFSKSTIVVTAYGPTKTLQKVSLRIKNLPLLGSHLSGNLSVIRAFYSEFHDLSRRHRGEETNDGVYKTLSEAEAAIAEFIQQYGSIDYPFEKLDLLNVVMDPTLLSKDDSQLLDELEQVKQIFVEQERICNRFSNYSPESNFIRSLRANSINGLDHFISRIRSFRHSLFKMSIKQASQLADVGILYSTSIKDCIDFDSLATTIDVIVDKLRTFYMEVKIAEASNLSLIDINEKVDGLLKEIGDIIPNAIELLKNSEKPEEDKAMTPEEIAALPRGSIASVGLFEASYRMMNFLIENIEQLQDVDSKRLISVLQKLAVQSKKYHYSLINGTPDPEEMMKTIVDAFNEMRFVLKGVYESKKLSDIKDDFEKRMRRIVRMCYVFQHCFAQKGDIIVTKLFPGSLSLLYQSFNIIQDSEQLFSRLLKLDCVKGDTELIGNIHRAINQMNTELNTILRLNNNLKNMPLNEIDRFAIVHSVNVVRRFVQKVHDGIFRYEKDIDPSILSELTSFEVILEDLLYSLTPMNISQQRVYSTATSLDALINEMRDKSFDEAWIDRVKEAQNKFMEWSKELTENPTNGPLLYAINEQVRATIKDISFLDSYILQTKEDTIPLIIEILLPVIKRNLANPDQDDEYDGAKHIPLFAQMHLNMAAVISFLHNSLKSPPVMADQLLIAEIQRRLTNFCILYQKLTHSRPNILNNPYTFLELRAIQKIINTIKLQAANILSAIDSISAMTTNKTGIFLMCSLFKSINSFTSMTVELNIRPYRRIPTQQKILEYRKFLIEIVRILRDGEAGASPENVKLLQNESDSVMSIIKEVTKLGKTPNHDFDNIVFRIEKHIDEMFIHTAEVPNLWNDATIDKANDMSRANQRIIAGEDPTPELFTELINDFIAYVAVFKKDGMSCAKEAEDSDKIIQIQSITETVAQQLKIVVDQKMFRPRQIESVKTNLVWYFKSLPKVSAGCEDQEMYKNIILKFEDLINLSRQISIPLTIDYVGRKLEVSISDEIPELADVLKEQFTDIVKIFYNMLLHPIVLESPRIYKFLTEIYGYFHDRCVSLKVDRKTLEANLENFCRENEESFGLVIKRVKYLIPLLTDNTLIESVCAIQSNLTRVILLFDAHHLTASAAEEFKEKTIVTIREINNCSRTSQSNGSIPSDSKQFIEQLIAVTSEAPEDVSNVKTTAIQELCNKLYTLLQPTLLSNLPMVNHIKLGPLLISLYKDLVKFISVEYRRIFYTRSLIVQSEVVPENRLKSTFDQTLEATEKHEKIPDLVTSLLGSMETARTSVPGSLMFVRDILSSVDFDVEPVWFARMVAAVSTNVISASERLQQLAIQSTVKAGSLVNAFIERLSSIKARTIHHQQLLILLKQIDVDMIMNFKNLAAVSITFAPMRQAISLIPFAMIDDKETIKIANEFELAVYEASLSISVAIRILIANIITYFEMSEVETALVENIYPYLADIQSYATLDITSMHALSKQYISAQSMQSSWIELHKKKKPLLSEAANYVIELEKYRPFMMYWSQQIIPYSEELAIQQVQGACLSAIAFIERIPSVGTKNLIPFYFMIHSKIVTIVKIIRELPDIGVDSSNYDADFKKLESTTASVGSFILKLTNEKMAKDNLPLIIQALSPVIQRIYQATGGLDIEMMEKALRSLEDEKAEEEEEEKPEEETVEKVYVNVSDEFPKLVKLVVNRRTDDALELVKEMILSIEENRDNSVHKDQIYNLKTTLESNSDLQKFLDYASNFLSKEIMTEKRPESAEEITDAFIDCISDFKEIQDNYLNSEDKEEYINRIAGMLGSAQMNAITAIKSQGFVHVPIYSFLIQTIEQNWAAVLKIIEDKSEGVVGRAFRSAARLLADLSYVVEDLSLQSGPEPATALNNSRQAIFKMLAELLKLNGLVISVRGRSIVDKEFILLTGDKLIGKLNEIICDIITESKKLNTANMKKSLVNPFVECVQNLDHAVHSLQELLNVYSPLKQIILAAQNIHGAILSCAAILKKMTDVVERKPDVASAEKLNFKFTLPTVNDRPPIPDAVSQLEKEAAAVTELTREAQRLFLEDKTVSNTDIVNRILSDQESVAGLAKAILQLSTVTTEIEYQSSLAALAMNVSQGFNQLIKAMHDRFLLSSGWEGFVEEALALINEAAIKSVKVSKSVLSFSQQKKRDEDEDKEKILSCVTPFVQLQETISSYVTELGATQATLQRELAVNTLELLLAAAQASAKVGLFLKDHRREMNLSIPDFAKTMESVEAQIHGFVDQAKALGLSKDPTEDEISALVQKFGEPINRVQQTFKAKRAEGAALRETLDVVVKGAASLSKASQDAKAARIAREEAARKRAEEIAAKKAAAEERKKAIAARKEAQKSAAGKPLGSRLAAKTKDQLLRRLECEARVFRARMIVAEQQKIVTLLNS